MDTLKKIGLSKNAFWDIKIEDLESEQHKLFIIDRIVNYGTMDDFLNLIKFYGKKGIKKEIVKISYFDKLVFNFVCKYFDLSSNDFVCFKQRQSHQTHWDY